MITTAAILAQAKEAQRVLSVADTITKNAALEAMAQALTADAPAILAANALDLAESEGKISPVMMDRLLLTEERIQGMAEGVLALIQLPDPVGQVRKRTVHSNGMVIEQTAVPMGVVAIIYESRPNVTSDAAALCLKSGNVCVLRSGKNAWRSANAIVQALRAGLKSAGLPETCVNLIEDTTHASANELMTAVGFIDLLIPRGGAGLIRSCTQNAKVPCIQTGTGICHIYVDASADLDQALDIIENAKTSGPVSATPRRSVWSTGTRRRHFSPGWQSVWDRTAVPPDSRRWNCVWTLPPLS